MRIIEINPQPNWILTIVADDGRMGNVDVSPYFDFDELREPKEFMKVINGGYFVEWDRGADFSADTICSFPSSGFKAINIRILGAPSPSLALGLADAKLGLGVPSMSVIALKPVLGNRPNT